MLFEAYPARSERSPLPPNEESAKPEAQNENGGHGPPLHKTSCCSRQLSWAATSA